MTVTRFRKKPVEIEATQWDGTADGATRIIDWILNSGATATYACSNPERCTENDGDAPHSIEIRTLEGTMRAGLDDWIIRGVQGEFYPCKPDIFATTYEVAEPGTASAEQRAEAASRLGTRYMVRAERAEAAIERVRARHTRGPDGRCTYCLLDHWPCPTICLLDGPPCGPGCEEWHEPVEKPGSPAAEATEPADSARELISAAIYEHNNPGHPWADAHPHDRTLYGADADAVLAVILPGTRITAELARSADADVQRVIALYEQWVKAGAPPLGTSMSRWWDARLVELHDAILPPTDTTQEQEAPVDWKAIVEQRERELKAEGKARDTAEQERDGAYRERAHLVALLAAMTDGAVIAPALDLDEPDWRIAYLKIGGRQASWHIAPRDAGLFRGVERVEPDDPRAQWDGHTTDEKYAGIAAHTAELMTRCGPECAEMHTETGRCEIARSR